MTRMNVRRTLSNLVARHLRVMLFRRDGVWVLILVRPHFWRKRRTSLAVLRRLYRVSKPDDRWQRSSENADLWQLVLELLREWQSAR